MNHAQEPLSDVSLTEKSKLLADQEPLRYRTTEFQETDHAHSEASINFSTDTEGSSGEPFLVVPSTQVRLSQLHNCMFKEGDT